MESIRVYENSEFGALEVLTIDGITYYPAAHCARNLGYQTTTIALSEHCTKVGIIKRRLPIEKTTRGGFAYKTSVEKVYVSESNLRCLIEGADEALARPFVRWLLDKVLTQRVDETATETNRRNERGKEMKDLQVFSSSEFGDLDVLVIDGEEYFPASDCARILGYSNPRAAIARHCRPHGVLKRDAIVSRTNQYGSTSDHPVNRTYISEGNLYRLISHSKLPTAERFESWIFEEVLSRRHNAQSQDTQDQMNGGSISAHSPVTASDLSKNSLFDEELPSYKEETATETNRRNEGVKEMKDLQVFSSSEFGDLDVLVIDDKEYFPASDCARILGYSNPWDAIARHCKREGRVKVEGRSQSVNQYGATSTQQVERTYISEGNLYRLISRSKLPAAERFESWIFKEVLSRRHNAQSQDTQDQMNGGSISAHSPVTASDLSKNSLFDEELPSYKEETATETNRRNEGVKEMKEMKDLKEMKEMKDLQVFSSLEFGDLDVLVIGDKEYFPASDCARILGYSNPWDAIARHCKGEGRVKVEGCSQSVNQYGATSTRQVERTYISEGNLYRLISHSKLPTAERFESWIFEEVVPTLRKQGSYTLNQGPGNSTSMDLVLDKLSKVERYLIETADDVRLARLITASKDSVNIGDFAKILRANGIEIGHIRLLERLRMDGFLMRREGAVQDHPTQLAVRMGVMRLDESPVVAYNGKVMINFTTVITPKGQKHFAKLYGENSQVGLNEGTRPKRVAAPRTAHGLPPAAMLTLVKP